MTVIGGGQEKTGSFPKLFSKKSGKVLTEKKQNVSLETFPLKRKRFFEIYFVRLIGTPNQHIPKWRRLRPAPN
jgi:hypothetical protein